MTHRLLTVLLVGVALTLGGCTDDAQSAKPADERLASAAAEFAAAESLDISLRTPALPSGVRGLLSATGVGDHSPAFSGTVDVVAGGATIGAEIIAVDGRVWAKAGFSPVWAPLDPKDFGAPDPAALVGTDAQSGLAGLLQATDDLETGAKSRDGDLVLTQITGTIAGSRIAALIPSADTATDFKVVYRLTDDDRLHDATLSGPFYGDDEVTYTLTLTARDEPARIEAP